MPILRGALFQQPRSRGERNLFSTAPYSTSGPSPPPQPVAPRDRASGYCNQTEVRAMRQYWSSVLAVLDSLTVSAMFWSVCATL